MPPTFGQDRVGELLGLFRQLDECTDAQRAKTLKQAAVAIIEEVLHDDLRGIMLHHYGRQVDRDGSRPFTELLNTFFVRILRKSPPGLAKLRTRNQLLAYVSMALGNMLRDHHAKRVRASEEFDALALLAEERQRQLDEACQLDLQLRDVVAQLDAWDESEDKRLQEYSTVIRFRFLLGMTLEAMGQELKCSKSGALRKQQAAIKELRDAICR